MAEKKTAKKASKQAKPKAVDMVTPVTTADETGLELTETMVQEPMVEELENPSTDAIMQAPDDAELVFEEKKEVAPKKSVVETEECETVVTDDHDAEACTPEHNQELETPEPMFKEDKVMVNDITNILNGLDGVDAKKIGLEDEVFEEEKEEKKPRNTSKNTTNTEEKNYFSEQFSRNWGGVMYDY